MENYIEDKKKLYSLIYEFVESSEEMIDEHNDEELINLVKSQQIEGEREEMLHFLEIIKSIADNHHRSQQFNNKINHILLLFKEQIKQTLSNYDIFHIFGSNKKIVLFLLKNDIMTITDQIYKEIQNKVEANGNFYWHFFIHEIENFIEEEKMQLVKNELLDKDSNFFDNYEEKRQEGENDSYICSLIRHDSVEEFISYINHYNISHSSKILPSIFETNSFLIDNKNTTFIEYSAFFGSIQIFQYLLNNKVELTPSLWFYAIHSKNAELIHLLESNEVSPQRYENFNYVQCFIESIKCHHNSIADYIESNLMDQEEKDSEEQKERIISNCIKYHNYAYFQNDTIIDHGFFYLNFYHYDKLFELLFKKKEKEIEMKSQEESSKNDVEVIYYLLLDKKTISNDSSYSEIKKIVIPSSVTSIGNYAFIGCSSLTQIIIPSSVTSIGKYAFYECSSLTQITISSSVTSIEPSVFKDCSLLSQVTFEIPSSIISIRDCAFLRCTSLAYIIIPSSVTLIGGHAFSGCTSLAHISIPSSVTLIGGHAFSGCSSLVQIIIPSSVTSIGNSAFYGCSSLTQITIPSSVTSIGNSSFRECSSLTQISIPYFLEIRKIGLNSQVKISRI